MRGFRWHRRPLAFLALLALTLQLGLAFGHVHGLQANSPAALSAAGGTEPSPPGTAPHHDDSDYCPTCAVLALLAGAQTASTPPLAVPAAPVATQFAFAADAVRSDPCCAAFRSRAPPLS